jgi:hypothetical protein
MGSLIGDTVERVTARVRPLPLAARAASLLALTVAAILLLLTDLFASAVATGLLLLSLVLFPAIRPLMSRRFLSDDDDHEFYSGFDEFNPQGTLTELSTAQCKRSPFILLAYWVYYFFLLLSSLAVSVRLREGPAGVARAMRETIPAKSAIVASVLAPLYTLWMVSRTPTQRPETRCTCPQHMQRETTLPKSSLPADSVQPAHINVVSATHGSRYSDTRSDSVPYAFFAPE